MKKIVTIVVGVAAMIYIGQFAYGFKQRADDADAANKARVDRMISDILREGK